MNCLIEIGSYVEFLKKKRNIRNSNIEEIKNLLILEKDSNFIEKLNKENNSKPKILYQKKIEKKVVGIIVTLRSRYKEFLRTIILTNYK